MLAVFKLPEKSMPQRINCKMLNRCARMKPFFIHFIYLLDGALKDVFSMSYGFA